MKGMALEEVASKAGWTHSVSASPAGHELFKLLTVLSWLYCRMVRLLYLVRIYGRK